jgi:phosphoribosylformylglycinamidine synthase
MVGIIEKPEHVTTQWFKDEGDAILLLGELMDAQDPLHGLGGSAYLQQIHGLKTGTPPRCDLEKEHELHLALRSLIYSGVIKSAHDCSEGGLAVALTECCISQQIARDTPRLIGAQIDLTAAFAGPEEKSEGSATNGKPASLPRLDSLLFGEARARIIISVPALQANKVLAQAKILGVPAIELGRVGGTTLQIKAGESTLTADLGELHDAWWNSIARAMQ